MSFHSIRARLLTPLLCYRAVTLDLARALLQQSSGFRADCGLRVCGEKEKKGGSDIDLKFRSCDSLGHLEKRTTCPDSYDMLCA